MPTNYVLISSIRSTYVITIHYRLPALLNLPLDYVAAKSFVPFGKKVEGLQHLSLKIGRDAAKNQGRNAALK